MNVGVIEGFFGKPWEWSARCASFTSLEGTTVLGDSSYARDKMAIPPDAIARAIAFAIEQPANVDVNEIVVRPTAQG